MAFRLLKCKLRYNEGNDDFPHVLVSRPIRVSAEAVLRGPAMGLWAVEDVKSIYVRVYSVLSQIAEY